MNIKKMLIGISTTSLMTVGLFSTVSATPTVDKSNHSSQILFEQNEIKDLQVLFDHAKKGISDVKVEKIKQVASLQNVSTKEMGQVQMFTTTQHLKTEKRADGQLLETFATTSFAVPLGVPSSYDGGKGDSGVDKTFGVKAYSTVYYNNVYDSNNALYYKLLNVTGGWTIEDSSESISNRQVRIGESGSYLYAPLGDQIQYNSLSTNTFSYDAPSNWAPVMASASPAVGGTQICTLSSRSSTWSFSWTNNL